jgi:cytochrome b561
MQDTQTMVSFPTAGPARQAERFDATSMTLHWLTAVLVAGQFATALVHDQVKGEAAVTLLMLHRSAGVLTWLVVVGRLIWRRWYAFLPPFPAHMPRLQQSAAKLNEYGLYGLLVLQPLTGAGNTLMRGKPFVLSFWDVPVMFGPNKPVAHLFAQAHETGAWLLLALIGLHVGAALFHALVLRDRVLQRMLPG